MNYQLQRSETLCAVLVSCVLSLFLSTTLLANPIVKDKKNPPNLPKQLTQLTQPNQPVYPHAMERIASVREMYDGALSTDMAVNTFRNIDRLFPSRRIAAGTKAVPLPRDPQAFQNLSFLDRGRRFTLDQYLELNKVAALLILKDGKIKAEQYRFRNTEKTRWM